jgi:hypothetical protein
MTTTTTPSRALHISLWIVQGLLFVTFVGGAIWKLATPLPELAAKMPWMGEVPHAFFVVTALVDLAGGLGVLLPTLTRIQPRLAPLAAVGLTALQVSAIVFHFSRGEGANTPFNFVLTALALFVFWGRAFQAPVPPRNA